MGTGGKWVRQARGQEGPSWLKAKGQAVRQTLSGGILEMFWGAKGLDGTTCGVGDPCGFWPKVAPPEQVRRPGAGMV